MTIPDVHELGQVIYVGEVDLCLDRVLERASARLQPGLEASRDQKLCLQPDIGPIPERIWRAVGLRIKTGHGFVVRHLPSNEHIVAARERSDEAGMLWDRNTVGAGGARLTPLARQNRQQ